MTISVNLTQEYHKISLDTLGWEFTVCNSLEREGTSVRKILRKDSSYGMLLYDFLSLHLPMSSVGRVVEIGGGYGCLMRDFVKRDSSLRPYMIDVSPFLLSKQKEMLRGSDVVFKEGDFLEIEKELLKGFDLAIMNENLGDFPTLTGIRKDMFQGVPPTDDDLKKALRFVGKYELELPDAVVFSMNTGALEAVEKLCDAGIPYIFVGEHSCEALVPDNLKAFIRIESPGIPERITLMGHDEYSLKFSYLEKVSRYFNYSAIRGPFADFIPVEMTGEILYALSSGGCYSDEHEIICQFVEDLYKYEYLIMKKDVSFRQE